METVEIAFLSGMVTAWLINGSYWLLKPRECIEYECYIDAPSAIDAYKIWLDRQTKPRTCKTVSVTPLPYGGFGIQVIEGKATAKATGEAKSQVKSPAPPKS